jgi:hypothetical protein
MAHPLQILSLDGNRVGFKRVVWRRKRPPIHLNYHSGSHLAEYVCTSFGNRLILLSHPAADANRRYDLPVAFERHADGKRS